MRLAELLLTSAGHAVLSAVAAESGLKLARERQPDLILMDIHLPEMDGLTATPHLKKDAGTAAIPGIALTAMAMEEDKEKIGLAGLHA
ncbi:response regulator [Pseudomonas syringae]|nr:response regulator [Pseudomonas syringae]